MQIALAGNPNAGKSTLFNALTGGGAHVANYPGVTVERREAPVLAGGGGGTRLVDLPGCYSLTARSPEEEVAHAVLMGHLAGRRPDCVVCLLDATQLGRALYLAVQLLEHDLPVVLALSMADLARRRGLHTDVALLAARLGAPVVAVDARRGEGLTALLAATAAARPGAQVRDAVLAALTADDRRAVDELAAALPGPEATAGNCLWLLTSSLDEVALPLPAALRAAAAAAQARLAGTSITFGGGGAPRPPTAAAAARAQAAAPPPLGDAVALFRGRVIAARYGVVDALLDGVQTRQPRPDGAAAADAEQDPRTAALDRLLLHPVGGLVAFAAIMLLLFQAVFAWAQPAMAAVEGGVLWLGAQLAAWLPAGHFRSLVVDGVLGGVGSVLAFVPQIALLFAGIAVLEESGYMARAAFLLDRTMRRAGLHGRAFIPLMSSFACAVPGIMAARTVEARRDRLVTIMVAPFMSCSARLPVYTLVIGAVFAGAPPLWGWLSVGGLVIGAMYLLGLVAALGTAWALKRTLLRSPLPPLVLELPVYRLPAAAAVARQVGGRCAGFVRDTGGTILALSVLLWAALTFPQVPMPAPEQARQLAAAARVGPVDADSGARLARAWRLEHSLGGRVGHLLEPAIAPLGFDWRIGIGLVASLAAREVLVSTLGQVYALDSGGGGPAGAPSLRAALRADRDPGTGQPRFTRLRGLSLMVFFVLAMQCLSTVAVVRRETGGWRWPLLQLGYMNGLAYGASLAVYQGGRALGLEG